MGIPSSLGDLTPEWFTEVLREGGAIERERVTAFSLGHQTDREGLTAQTRRIALQYDIAADPAPRTVILKLSSSTPALRQRPNTQAAYCREVGFYQHVAPTCADVPRCYHASYSAETGDHVLVLEDLDSLSSGDRVGGCSMEQAELAVRHIAAFHASWWESRQLDCLDWLADPKPPQDDERAALHSRWWPDFLVKAGHMLPDSLHDSGRRLGEHRGEILRHLSSRPRTLVHSDYHLDNLMFGEDVDQMAIVDWQFLSKGRGIWDVGFFLCQSLRSDDRRAAEDELLRLYVESLAAQGVSYALEICAEDYRYCLLRRFGALISSIAAMPFTPKQIQMHIDVLLPRCVSALLDQDAASLLR